MINHSIANLINFIHKLLVIYVLVGHYLTPDPYLKYYLFLIIFIFLDWNDFDGQCFLTNLEHYFRTGSFSKVPPTSEDAPEFFRPIVNKLFNLNLTRNEGDRLNNFVFMMCFLLGFIRLLSIKQL